MELTPEEIETQLLYSSLSASEVIDTMKLIREYGEQQREKGKDEALEEITRNNPKK